MAQFLSSHTGEPRLVKIDRTFERAFFDTNAYKSATPYMCLIGGVELIYV